MERWAYGALAAVFIAACSGTQGSSHGAGPTAPSPPVLSAVVITTASSTPSVIQLIATARFTDGATREVTNAARWESLNTAVALVSNGTVTIVAAGDAEVRASYWGVTGSFPLHVAAPPPHWKLQGTVWEVPPTQRPLAGARVEILDGPENGRVAIAGPTGAYEFADLIPGVLILRMTLDGYQMSQVGFTLFADRVADMWLTPTPPKDTAGATATARCKDGTWSWSQDLRTACIANGGIAYFVCPGPFCDKASGRP